MFTTYVIWPDKTTNISQCSKKLNINLNIKKQVVLLLLLTHKNHYFQTGLNQFFHFSYV